LDDVYGRVRVDHDGPVHHHLHRLHLHPEQVLLGALVDEMRPAGDVCRHAVVQRRGRSGGAGYGCDGAAFPRHHVGHRGWRVVPGAVRATHAVQALLVAVVVVAG